MIAVDIPVLIEPVEGRGFQARAGEPFALTAEGATREEALGNLRAAVESKVQAGAAFAQICVPLCDDHPLARFAGGLPDDPLLDDWRNAVDELRRRHEQDPHY